MDVLIDNKYTFIFVIIRISIMFTFGVFYGDKRISKMLKFSLIFLISIIVTPTINTTFEGNMSDFDFFMIIASEFLIGLIIGYVSSLITHILQMAGSIIDMQGGFGMAQVFDPTTQTQSSLVAQFLSMFGMLFFLANNFHITFLEIIIRSFNSIPIGSITTMSGFSPMIMDIIKIIVSSISIAICVALPIIGIIFMVDIILGICTRTMPQLNLYSVGYIVKILITMMLMYVYALSFNYFVNIVCNYIFNCLERLV